MDGGIGLMAIVESGVPSAHQEMWLESFSRGVIESDLHFKRFTLTCIRKMDWGRGREKTTMEEQWLLEYPGEQRCLD